MQTLVSEEKYSDGQTIFRDNSAGDWVYVVLSGSVEISKTINDKKCILGLLKEGEIFGELAFLGNTKRTASATAVGDTVVGVIDRDSLDREYNKLSSDFRSILVSISDKFKKLNARITELSGREEPRLKKKLSVSYKDKQSFLNAYTGNISNGGLFLRTDNPLDKGDSLLLQLQLPNIPAPLQINCVVIWCNRREDGDKSRPPGMGIQFRGMNESDRAILANYIKSIKNS